MSLVLDLLSWLAIVIGGAFVLIGGIGVLRLPDIFARFHAAGATDTMGAGLIMLGLMLQADSLLTAAKLLLILAFFLVTSPTAAHALAKAALHSGLRPRVVEEEPRA